MYKVLFTMHWPVFVHDDKRWQVIGSYLAATVPDIDERIYYLMKWVKTQGYNRWSIEITDLRYWKWGDSPCLLNQYE